jgi:NAD(P)H-dependent FMN reductase
MIIIISGTNRPNSRTSLVSKACLDILSAKGQKTHLLSLEDLNGIELNASLFSQMPSIISEHQNNFLIPNNKWIIVAPEYNGDMPGILKYYIDLLSVSKRNETFKNKKVSLIGVSAGRAGNLRGMESLTGLLNYLGTTIFPNKLPLSSIESLIDKNNNLLNEATLQMLFTHLDEIINF